MLFAIISVLSIGFLGFWSYFFYKKCFVPSDKIGKGATAFITLAIWSLVLWGIIGHAIKAAH